MSFLRNPSFINRLVRYTIVLTVVWTSAIIILAVWAIENNNRSVLATAEIEARASFEKDLLYRRWASMHGGVYVPVTEDTPPNPYLNVPDKDVTTTSGLELTLINPAYMTRQVYEMLEEQGGVRGHITSLNPIRPENLPDEWEREALINFETSQTTEYSATEYIDGVMMLRYIRAMFTEESCLKCHAIQGYELGDIRGGISISVPLAPYFDTRSSAQNGIVGGHALLWILGMIGIGIGARRIAHVTAHDQTMVKKLALSEVRYRQMFEDNNAVKLIIEPSTGRIVNANYAAVAFYGYSHDELTSMTIQQINTLPESEVRERMEQAKSKKIGYFDFNHRLASGEIRNVAVFSSPIDMMTDTFLYSIIIDITAKHEAEKQRNQMVNQMHFLNQTAMDMLTLNDKQAVFDYVGRQIHGLLKNVIVLISEPVDQYTVKPSAIFGVTDTQLQMIDEVFGKKLIGSVFPVTKPVLVNESLSVNELAVLDWLKTVTSEDSAHNLIETLDLKTLHSTTLRKGEQIFAHVKILNVEDYKLESFNMIDSLIWQASMTLQRLQTEQELRETEQRQRLTLMGTRAGTWEWNVQTGETIFNERWAEIIGYRLEELEPVNINTWLTMLHPEDAERSEQLLNAHFSGESPNYECEVRMRHKEGYWVWVLDRGTVMEWTDDGKPLRMFGTHVDVTRRKEAEQASIANEERLRMIVDNIPIMLSFFDENGNFELTNAFWNNRLGWASDDLKACENPLEMFYPDSVYRQMVMDHMLSGESGWRDFQTQTRNNGMLITSWANVRLSDGRSIGIGQDVTELRQVQQQQLDLQLERERSSLLTTFIQNAAHEFRTPLSTINSSAYLMSRIEDPERRAEKSRQIEQQVANIGELIHKLLLMTRLESNDPIELVSIDLSKLLQTTCDTLREKCCDTHKIQTVIDPNLPPVMGDNNSLDEAFKQILDNACRYSSPEDMVTIEAYQHGSEICINIHDEGIGISHEDIDHVFETFWRHDKAHTTPGFGLGLPIAQRIVKRHRGRIEIESQLGKGTNVRLWLPIGSVVKENA